VNRYPLLRYHNLTGQQRLVMSAEEEAELGPEWGNAQPDVRYPSHPAPFIEIRKKPPVFSIEIPEAK
jgi:hypothetical protein